MNVTVNSSKPVATFSTAAPHQESFTVSIRNIQEWEGWQETLYTVNTQDQVFTSSNESTPLYKAWVLNAILDNQANVTIVIQLFTNSTSLAFANRTANLATNALKIYVEIQDWPFSSINNSLAVVFDIGSPGAPIPAKNVHPFLDSGNNLQWMTIDSSSLPMFGEFSPYASVDGRTRILPFVFNNTDGSVTAVIPHFWEVAKFSTSYSVLWPLSTTTPNAGEAVLVEGGGLPRTTYIAIFVPVVCLAIACVLVYLAYPRIVLALQLRHGRRSLQMGPVQVEKAEAVSSEEGQL